MLHSTSAPGAFDTITLASSFGGIEALCTVLSALPANFPAAVAVVQHVSPTAGSHLPAILGRHCRLPVEHATLGGPLLAGQVYLAPGDRHFLLDADGRAVLAQSPRLHHSRPAADPLFSSAAAVFQHRVLGVVLTGFGSDAAVGTQAIKLAGGMVLAQDPVTCRGPQMPRAAIATGCVDLVLPLRSIGEALIALTMVRGAAEYLRVPPKCASGRGAGART